MGIGDLYDNIKIDYENMIWKFKDSDFGAFVHTGPIQGGDKSKMVGRLVQVRVKAGIAGTDRVFLRHSDNSLIVHENQSFVRIIDEDDLKLIQEVFSKTDKDNHEEEYTYRGKEPATGFIVEGMPESQEVLAFSIMTTKGKS